MRKILILTLLALVNASSAYAQVAIEGMASFRMKQYGSRLNSEAFVSKVSNYNYNGISGAKVILGLSQRPFQQGVSMNGLTVASAYIGEMSPRTYYTNIRLTGSSSIRSRGTFRVVLLVLDGSNGIHAGLTFRKAVNVNSNNWYRRFNREFKRAVTTAPSLELTPNSIPSYWQVP